MVQKQINKQAECVRRVGNWSKIEPKHRFDKSTFRKKDMEEDIELASPKMDALFHAIQELDKRDMENEGRLYKHMIYTDVKALGYGAKIIAAAFLARGYNPAYKGDFQVSPAALAKNSYTSFALLCSTPVYEKPITVKLKTALLQTFNSRPDNIHGKNLRFLILDQGYKEGIDVFDIKYIHLFEPTITAADEKQAIGRGTRMCGQRGLNFHQQKGWPLYVYRYNSKLPKDEEFRNRATVHELFLDLSGYDVRAIQLANELERMCILGAVDYELTKSVHSFSLTGKGSLYSMPPEVIIELGREPRVLKKTRQKEKIVLYGKEYHKGQPIRCSEKCKGVIQIPTNLLLLAWIVASNDRTPFYDNKPRWFLCREMAMNQNYCRILNLAWKDPAKFVQERRTVIYNSLNDILRAKQRYVVKSHVYDMAALLPYDMQQALGIATTAEPTAYLPSHAPPPQKLSFLEMREHILREFADCKWPEVSVENRCEPQQQGGTSIVKFTPTQEFIMDYFKPTNPYKGMLLYHSVGSGKCHAKDTPILMYDGTIKMVQDIKVGDLLMGDDSTPRTVLSLASGYDEMYDVIPVKGDKYTVNSEHILCLKPTPLGIQKLKKYETYAVRYYRSNGKQTTKTFKTEAEAKAFSDGIHINNPILEIPVKDYIKLSKASKSNLKGYRVGVEIPEQPLPIDPQLFGIWLGDGGSRDPKITTADPEILEFVRSKIEPMGLKLHHEGKYDYRISTDGQAKAGSNPFYTFMKKYNLVNNKHIPHVFLANSRENRLKLLAGLIDTDGHLSNGNYEITQKSNKIAEGILYLARSLGFAAYSKKCEKSCMYKGEKKTGVYNRIIISGDICKIPVILPHKKACERKQVKNVLVTGIDVKHVGRGKYYGFVLDGNHRYLLGDFTVTHNTCTAIATATNSFEKQNYTILWVTRHTLKSDIWKNMFQQVCSIVFQEKLQEGLQIPKELKDQKRLLPPNWIEPISYKQFSNFLSGRNKKLEKAITDRNGHDDPLHKTLIIIDEAHKLYAPDVPAAERPNVDVLRKMIQASYKKSGQDSARVLLMSATPYTADPMELIKLLNILREEDDQFPEDFEQFKRAFLDDTGRFTTKGAAYFIRAVNGYISYLNREKDVRQFAYPILKEINVPISQTPQSNEKLEKELVTYQKTLAMYQDIIKEEVPRDIAYYRDNYKEDSKDCKDLPTKKERDECKARITKEYKAEREKLEYELSRAKKGRDKAKADITNTKNKMKLMEKEDVSQETALRRDCFKDKK